MLHTTQSLSASRGGVARAVSDICSALADLGVDISLIYKEDGQVDTERCMPQNADVGLVMASGQEPLQMIDLDVRACIARVLRAQHVDIIHDNGIWRPANYWTYKLAGQFGVPLVISPHGMLESRALSSKRRKKNLAMMIFQKRVTESAAMFFAASEKEMLSIRRLGFTQPVAVVANGIDIEGIATFARHDQSKDTRTVLFLSRLHRIKGIDNLLSAWAKLKPVGWRLVIAGNDESNYRTVTESLIVEHGLSDCVEMPGAILEKHKARLFEEADLFVLPSYSESFGIVIAEALAYGVPVITTKGTPWQALEEFSCGWWIDIGPESLAKALRIGINLSPKQRKLMGMNGQKLVQTRFGWPCIAKDAIAAYRWVLGQVEKPSYVYTS